MQKKILLIALGLYILSTGISYVAFSTLGGGKSSSTPNTPVSEDDETSLLGGLLEIDPNEPKDQPCPLNGKLFTQTERNAWEQRRPLAVMIENHVDARPQSGLSDADIVFEALAEGGVTRYMAMFYCGVQAFDTTVAPVRSARTYFVELASGFNLPMYVHVGGANVPGPTNALGQIGDYGWELENDINQFSVGYPTFVRDYNRVPGKDLATEHTMVTTTEALWEVAADRGWTNITPEQKLGRQTRAAAEWSDGYDGWSFQQETPAPGSVTSIAYSFWSGYDDWSVEWEYDATTNTYKRILAGEPDIDLNTDRQIAASTVIVLLTREEGPLNEKKHMLYDIVGSGTALVFQNGQALEVDWEKKTRESELVFTVDGKPAELSPGLIWVSVLDLNTDVAY